MCVLLPQAEATNPSRRASQPPVITPVAGSIAMPCIPPTAVDHGAIASAACPRSVSAAIVSAENAPLNLHASAIPQTRARGVDRVLDAEAEIDVLDQRLHLRLADAVTAGRTESQHRSALRVAMLGANGSASGAPGRNAFGPRSSTSPQ